MRFQKGQIAWNKNQKTPEYIKKKQSLSAIKRFEDLMERQKVGKWHKNRKDIKDIRKKQSISAIKRFQNPLERKKLSEYRKGKKDTEYTKKLKSEARKREWMEGKRKGYKQSKEQIEKRVRRGENHYNWQDGITDKYRSIRRQKAYWEWRMVVWKRDNFKCQMPDCVGNKRKLNAHHIITLKENENLKYDINNGITLCEDCHNKVKWKEKQYEELFKGIIKKYEN